MSAYTPPMKHPPEDNYHESGLKRAIDEMHIDSHKWWLNMAKEATKAKPESQFWKDAVDHITKRISDFNQSQDPIPTTQDQKTNPIK